MSKIQTVNVLECTDTNNLQYNLNSFVDDEVGNKQAEELFIEIIKKNGADIESDEDKNFYLDEGVYTNGTYSCVLIHAD